MKLTTHLIENGVINTILGTIVWITYTLVLISVRIVSKMIVVLLYYLSKYPEVVDLAR